MRKLLLPISWLYQCVVFFRNMAYDQNWFKVHALDVPIISIGNISVGGTGKTPMAEYVLSWYIDQGFTPAYLSRGYGRKSKGFFWVKPSQDQARQVGDEALQVARKFPNLPVAVCEDRAAGIKRMTREGNIDVVVLDDAFQHRRVARNLDIVLLDANRMPDKDFFLPAGNLREGRKALLRADLVIVNKVADPGEILSLKRRMHAWYPEPPLFCVPSLGSPVLFFPERILKPVEVNRAIVFSGIGNNAFFRRQVEEMGLEVVDSFFFRDHYVYQMQDLVRMQKAFEQRKVDLILTTEKDYCRLKDMKWLPQFSDLPLAYLPLKLEWHEGEHRLAEVLGKILSTGNGQH